MAIIPDTDTIYAPLDGKIIMISETNHAFGIEGADGLSILVHIGIDTVSLNGQGFTRLSQLEKKVSHGDPVISIDKNNIPKDTDLTTIVIVTEGKLLEKRKPNLGKKVTKDDSVLV